MLYWGGAGLTLNCSKMSFRAVVTEKISKRQGNKIMKKRTIIIWVVAVAFLLVIAAVVAIPIRQSAKLRSLENAVANIQLPDNIEKIAIKSGVGDSGGNGNQSSLRVVLAVKTELSLSELKETIVSMNLYFPGHFKNANTPIFYITHCDSAIFQSPRQFTVTFDEMLAVTDYSDYYYIEFVE